MNKNNNISLYIALFIALTSSTVTVCAVKSIPEQELKGKFVDTVWASSIKDLKNGSKTYVTGTNGVIYVITKNKKGVISGRITTKKAEDYFKYLKTHNLSDNPLENITSYLNIRKAAEKRKAKNNKVN